MEAVQEEHVTSQVREERLGRIEALLERNLVKQEELAGDIQVLKIKADSLRESVQATNKRIDFLRDTHSDTIALWGIALALWANFAAIAVGVIKLFMR